MAFHHLRGEGGLLAADLLRRARNHQHRQIVDVLQFGAGGAAFLKDARFGRARHRADQQKNRQQQT